MMDVDGQISVHVSGIPNEMRGDPKSEVMIGMSVAVGMAATNGRWDLAVKLVRLGNEEFGADDSETDEQIKARLQKDAPLAVRTPMSKGGSA